MMMIGWSPLPDITLHELAVALGLLVNAQHMTKLQQVTAVNALPANVRRHFQ